MNNNKKGSWIIVNIFGRLAKDPVMKTFGRGPDNQMKVTEFSVAVQNRKNVGSSYMNCAVFGAAAEEAAQTLRKGLQISVIGRLELYKFKDRDFNDRDANKIYVSEFCLSGQVNSQPAGSPNANVSVAEFESYDAAGEDQNETELLNDTNSDNPETI